MRLLCTVLCKLMWKSWWNGENERKKRLKNPIERWAKETNRHRQKEINIKCLKYIKKDVHSTESIWIGKGEPTGFNNLLKFIQPVQVVTDCSDCLAPKCFFFKRIALILSVVHLPSTHFGFFALKIIELN